jgi:CTP synthase
MKNHVRVKIDYLDSETITPERRVAAGQVRRHPGARRLWQARRRRQDLRTARYAREHKVPYLGICLGMQVATIEYARHVAGLKDANSTEFEPDTQAPGDRPDHRVERRRRHHQEARRQLRPGRHHAPGRAKLRRGPGTLAHSIYGDVVTERHRHRYEANVNYLDQLRKAGLVISALTQREHLTEIVELPQSVHPWYMGVQFHPEFKSTPWDGHPLFNAFIKAALEHQNGQQSLKAACHETLRISTSA